jgi:hypothetical protein
MERLNVRPRGFEFEHRPSIPIVGAAFGEFWQAKQPDADRCWHPAVSQPTNIGD